MKTKERGITLIALVVTIIVLLILAGVSIQMLVGQNGLIRMAREVSGKTRVSQIEEQITLAQFDTMDQHTGMPDGESLVTAIKAIDGVDSVKYNEEEGVVEVTYEDEDGNKGGLTKKIPVGKTVLTSEEDFKNKVDEDVDKTKDSVQALDAYGNLIEGFEDRWYYEWHNGGFRLGINDRLKDYLSAYKGDIVDGTIIGEIPVYIVQTEGGKIIHEGLVKSYLALFGQIESLTHLPDSLVISPLIDNLQYCLYQTGITEIPKQFMTFSDNVTTLQGCFSGSKITEIPPEFKLGKNVRNIESLFENTPIETIAPNFIIPDTVEECGKLFYRCGKLKTIGEGFKLGKAIVEMHYLFGECKLLEYFGHIVVPSTVKDMHGAFSNLEQIDNRSSVTLETIPTADEKYTNPTENVFRDTSENKKDNPLIVYYPSSYTEKQVSEIFEGDFNKGYVNFQQKQ